MTRALLKMPDRLLQNISLFLTFTSFVNCPHVNLFAFRKLGVTCKNKHKRVISNISRSHKQKSSEGILFG